MAEAFLQVILDNLSSLIKDEIGLMMGVDDEMNKLSSTFTAIQAVLEDAEEKQLKSKAVRDWLIKLKDLTYEVEDILDECATQAALLEHRFGKSSRFGMRKKLKKILFQSKIGRRMKQVTQKLDAVAAEREKFHLRELPIDKPREIARSRERGSILNEPHLVYGRESDKEKIVDILVNQVKDNQQISILPIIGLGGLGKTTLAQLIINDQRVVEHFDKKIWVCVSDNFDLKTLIKAMIESVTGNGSASDLFQLDTLQRRLMELLNQKRYLLILDDVWNEHQDKWVVRRALLDASQRTCFWPEEKKYPNLEAIGKEIVKKCAGVPLAAKALGGLLRFKRTEKEWINLKESEILDLPQQDALILPALRLSYHHLPFSLRQCFAYCAVFPKDYEMDKEDLIFRWMAHGYISSKGKVEVEDVGDQVCNELVLRSLLQDVPGREESTFIMHDLVHDLAQSIMDNIVPGTRNVRSASNNKIREVNLLEKYVAFPTSNQPDQMDMSSILMNFCCLRMLDAQLMGIRELSRAIGNLKHLRNLNLSYTKIRSLPDSICSLWNLQNLNLDCCRELVVLPKNMRYLHNLRHLLLEGCVSLSEMPCKIRELTGLRSLSMFVVGCDRGNQLEELECLNLGGKLEIRCLERVKNPVDAKKANLAEKKNLCHLSFEWQGQNVSKVREDTDERVLEALEPHPNLKSLRIRGFKGRSFPAWMTNSTLEKVKEIHIEYCENCLRLPKLGELPHLKKLSLAYLEVEYIVEDEGNPISRSIQFPSLETLLLFDLPNVKGFLKDQVMRQVSPNLQELRVERCSSFIFPPLSAFKLLHTLSCSSTTLASIPKMENLTTLRVEIDKNTSCIPIETLKSLTNLEKLTIDVGKEEVCEVPEEGLRALKSLKSLSIWNSKRVRCLAGGLLRHFTALEKLEIIKCGELVELPEGIMNNKYLPSLGSVSLISLGKMMCVPKAIQNLSSSLQTLYLENLPELNSLPDWLGDLSSLKELEIQYCPKVASLPATIQRMTNLKGLQIMRKPCPELKRRCEKGKGDDWHKIAHIHYLIIHD